MTSLILQTKLNIPRPQANIVPRPRIMERLTKGIDGKLTLISAPAGFGKSTLLMDWIHLQHLPFGWVSLDENDNDIGRFLTYFIAGLTTIDILMDSFLSSLLSPLEQSSLETILIPIINQISNTDKRFGFVLDDYHLINSKDVHSGVDFLLDYLPPNMHLVISSRADPPLSLARLRARGQMTEIRAADLRFDIDDTAKFFNQIRGFALPQEELQRLVNRTDGWIAGLQMVAIALEGKDNPVDYIRDVSGTQEYIADFLTTEVFNQQPEPIKTFLLKTSILDRLSAPLCDAVTGQYDALQILKKLKANNLFLIGLDDKNQWFRYHRLFADLNIQRLIEILPESMPDLCLKASIWFEENQLLPEAVDYALRGNNYSRAANLIEKQAETILIRSEVATFIRWMQKIPDDVIFERESLSIYYAWALLVAGSDLQSAVKYLDNVMPSTDKVLCRLQAVQSILAVYQRQVPRAIELARHALSLLPEEDLFFRLIAAWNLSGSLFISGDQKAGANMLEEVVRVSLAGNNYLVAIIALSRLGSYQMQEGNLSLAKDLFEKAINIRPDLQTQPIPAACEAMLGLGKVFWERYELGFATRYLKDGLQLSKRWRPTMDIDGYIVLAHINQSQGDWDGAVSFLKKAQKLAAENTTTLADDRFVALNAARMALRQGDLASVEEWVVINNLEVAIQEGISIERKNLGAEVILCYELVVYARYLMALKRFEEALGLLEKILQSMERLGHRIKIFEIQILISLILWFQGKTDEAILSINSVLELTQSAGFKRIFLDEGQSMASLIKLSISTGFESKFAGDIVKLFNEENREVIQKDKRAKLIEPLSEREIEVLGYLESELSVPEIAALLHIATSTLRTHIKNIYSKLGAHSRFEAIAKAEDLNIR